jgi:hypothetical protein
MTYAEHATLGEKDARRIEAAGEAIGALPEWREAVEIIGEIERDGLVAAVPTLVALWRDCAVVPVRNAAGRALFTLGTADAHDALQRTLDRADHHATSLAIRSFVLTDPARAFDRLSPYLSDESLRGAGGVHIASEILWFFQSRQRLGAGDERWMDVVDRLLREDGRWVRRALELRRDRRVEEAARTLLRALTSAELDEALARYPDPPAPAPRGYEGRRDFVSRYAAGDHQGVWGELRELGRIADPALREEVGAVAALTMKRVGENVARVTERLGKAGYPFDGTAAPWSPPLPDVEEHIRRIEHAARGPCPIALRAFWSVVGEVMWKHAEDVDVVSAPWGELRIAECDPLYVDGPKTLWWCVEDWLAERQEVHPEAVGPLILSLAPDYLHKANISGGAPYGIRMPSEEADPLFENEEHAGTFVEYLRLCFEGGGFSRLDRVELRGQAKEFVEGLKKGLEPF